MKKNFVKNKKNDTPGCIYYQMNKVDINCIHISSFAVPKNPNCYSHHQVKCGPDRSKNPVWGIKRRFDQ